MSIHDIDRARDALRALWVIRNTWAHELRGIVRGLIRSDIRQLRRFPQVKT
jgi:hypothetical protein